jgi:hypothetical protein
MKIQAIKYMLGEIDIMPENFPLKEGNFKLLLGLISLIGNIC